MTQQTTTLPTGVVPVPGGWSLRGYKDKGGGGGRTPVEAKDSLHSTSYARVLDLVSEGEIEGLVNGLQSIYLDGTPLQSAAGVMNFSGVQVDLRTGTQQQGHIPGFPAAEQTIGVGVELRSGTPWVRAVNNRSLSAVRIMLGVDGLSKVDTSNGDIIGYTIRYAIDLQTDAGAWVEVVNSAFSGKTTQQYRRTHRIDLPAATSGWQVRVRRLTANANSSIVADTTVIDSITEVVDAKLRYPMSALVGLQIDASQFQSVPTRAYHMRGRIIRVPSNYDPRTRVYTGVWDGTFKTAWTNNPAWVFFDLVTNDRYGLGNQISANLINKWALYRIGAYCDELVPDGRGGQEPRFTCNVYLQQRGDATRVLQDLCSIFRGMVYWATGAAVPVADMPRDPVYTYTQANVVDGRFVYTGSRRKDRNTVALVSYNDMTDMGRQKVVYVQDDAAVARYGIRKVEISAFGCTSEAQAYRAGQWALLTAQRETRSVSFSVGLEGTLCAPGQIIRVADNMLAGRRIGGRIKEATATTIKIDAELGVKYGDELTVILPSGVAETRKVTSAFGTLLTADDTTRTVDSTELTADMISLPGTTVTITAETPFSSVPRPQSVWALEAPTLKTQLYTVMSVTEGDGLTFDVTAVQHEPGKFSAIDYGTKLDDRPITVVPAKEQAAPTAVSIDSYEIVSQGISSTTVAITWDKPAGAVAYDVEWRRDNSDWVKVARQQTPRLEIENAYSGTYVARVRAVNSIETPSLWTESAPTEVNGLLSAPPAIVGFNATPLVFGIRLKWGYPDGLYIADHVEIRYGETNNFANAVLLGNFPYPQNTHELMGLSAAKSFFFWARIVDKNGLPGEWTAPLAGSSSSNAGEVLDYLDGQISETQLAQSLRTEIGKIPGIEIDIAEINTDLSGIATGIVGLGTQISTEAESRESADEALSSRIDVVSAGVSDNAAAITIEANARADADSALSDRIDTVAATAAGNTAAITSEATARANADEALSTRIDTLAATTGDNTAAITAEATARANADSALSSRIDTVASKADSNTAAIQNEATARANADSALSTQVNTVSATANSKGKVIYSSTAPAAADRLPQNLWIDTTGGANTPKRWSGTAWVAVTDKVATDAAAAAAAAQRGVSQNAAAIQNEATARANADSALAQSITTVQATANGAAASAQTALTATATTDRKLAAMYTMKVQLNANGAYHLAGIGVGVENNQGVLQSQVLVTADRFAVLPATTSAASAAKPPFVIQGGQVFMNQAFIARASIGSAKFADWLESDAVGPGGVPVLRLNFRTGEIQLNAPATGGGRMTLNNNVIRVFDANNTLRVRLGVW